MGNTLNVNLPKISQKIYQEWTAKTRLVKSCSNEFEGEFDLTNLEIDIPVFGHLSIHKTSIKERDVKPAPVEFKKGSTIRVIIDKGRYNHWGETKLNELMDKLDAEDSEVRRRLVQDWALDAEEELGIAVAKLPASRHIDAYSLLGNKPVDKTNILLLFDILKAKAKAAHMNYQEFDFFASEKIGTIARDAQLEFKSNPAKAAFGDGYVGRVNGIDLTELEIDALVKRNANTALVEAEYAIWKTRDGIQYVVPFKTTVSYELDLAEVLLGGTGYQTVEYYDFFNIYPERLYVVDIKYDADASLPTFTGANPTANVINKDNLKAVFGTVK